MLRPLELGTRSISFRLDLRVLVVRWHTDAPVQMVKDDYAKMLDAAVEHALTNWLLDVRRRDKLPAESSAWVNNTFYPAVAARLAPRRLRMAVLSPPSMTSLHTTDSVQKKEVATPWTRRGRLTLPFLRTRARPWSGCGPWRSARAARTIKSKRQQNHTGRKNVGKRSAQAARG